MKKKWTFIIFLLLIQLSVFGQYSTQGKDFYLGFMGASDQSPSFTTLKPAELSVYIAAQRDVSGTISNEQTGFQMPFSVNAGEISKIILPSQECFSYSLGDTVAVRNTGLHVEATDTISIYLSNHRDYSFDASVVLPIRSLGTEYKIANYKSEEQSSFLIVGTEDNTIVEIVLQNDVSWENEENGDKTTYSAGKPYQFVINKGQTILVAGIGMMGSTIKSFDCKKIAVFSGNYCPFIPNDCPACDVLVEQLPPTNTWGKHFIVNPTIERKRDSRIVVTAQEPQTQITIKKEGKEEQFTMSQNQYVEFELGLSGAEITANQPVSVTQYAIGGFCSGMGDPFMLWIAPTEQSVKDIVFSPLPTNKINKHYVQIITKTEYKKSTLLDGKNIENQFSTFPENEQYSIARIELTPTVHRLQNPSGLMAYVYGYATPDQNTLEGELYESYGYLVASAINNIADDFNLSTSNGNFFYYETSESNGTTNISDTIKITRNIKSDFIRIEWKLNNKPLNITETNNKQHSFTLLGKDLQFGENKLQMLIVRNCQTDTLTSSLWRKPLSISTNAKKLFVCNGGTITLKIKESSSGKVTWKNKQTGELFFGNPITILPTENTTFDVFSQFENETSNTLSIEIIVLDQFLTTKKVSICQGETYSFYGQTLSKSGIYKKRFLNQSGCDSIINLDLTVNPSYQIHNNVQLVWGEEITIGDNTYKYAGKYTDYLTSTTGCDSIVHTTIHIRYSSCPDIEIQKFFTPNNDGENERWLPKNLQCYQHAIVNIYDRYGKLLKTFNQTEPEGWDGIYLGKPMPTDTYWYEITLPEISEEFVGYFLLKR
ncbi:MAG: T9SS type B sorting domain-containing protein [Paludibacteraceae bacterium]|nr:T9SS type B sorting domain-containing protein [Paludibacteraceae bacterium]